MNLIDYNQVMNALDKERQYLLNREQYEAENILVHHAMNVIAELKIVRQPEIVQCKDCKFFEIKEWWQDGILMADACPTCNKWGGGCRTVGNGYCFMGKRRDDDDRR